MLRDHEECMRLYQLYAVMVIMVGLLFFGYSKLRTVGSGNLPNLCPKSKDAMVRRACADLGIQIK